MKNTIVHVVLNKKKKRKQIIAAINIVRKLIRKTKIDFSYKFNIMKKSLFFREIFFICIIRNFIVKKQPIIYVQSTKNVIYEYFKKK